MTTLNVSYFLTFISCACFTLNKRVSFFGFCIYNKKTRYIFVLHAWILAMNDWWNVVLFFSI